MWGFIYVMLSFLVVDIGGLCFYMLMVCMNLYMGVYEYSILKIINMSDKGHIVYKQNRKTVQQKYRGKIKKR